MSISNWNIDLHVPNTRFDTFSPLQANHTRLGLKITMIIFLMKIEICVSKMLSFETLVYEIWQFKIGVVGTVAKCMWIC